MPALLCKNHLKKMGGGQRPPLPLRMESGRIRLPEIRAITFDVGGTLLQPWPSVGDVYAGVAARHGVNIQPAALDQRFARAWRARKQFNHGRDEWAALVDETFAGLLECPPSETFFSEL